MNRTHSKLWFFSVPLLVSLALFGCGGDAELSPELQAHIDEYEELIESYEPKFKAVKGNLPELAKVAASYSEEAQAWMSKWGTVAPTLSDEDGKAIEAKIAELNRRAVKMMTGG